ncbi:MAG: HAMP domain-containing protein [Deltaproteobacteria bacterium]|nr:HAMP domain-containing protein [Deltaproteobacteria bacterium]MBZ0219618.1 HAMP domain-containing protein [Deltaproteobacteria bacterium]
MSNRLAPFIFSIRTKFLLMVLCFTAALMLTVLNLINYSVGDIVLEESLEKGLAVAAGVAATSADPLLTQDDLTLFTNVKDVTRNKGILYGMIIDGGGRVMAHSDIALRGKEHLDPPGATVFREGQGYSVRTYDGEDGLVYDISVPIKSLRLADSIGYVRIGMSRGFIDSALERVKKHVKYLTYLGLFFGGVGAVLLTTVVVRPVKDLVKSAKAIGSGDLDYRIEVKRRDEVGVLMNAFNEMAGELKQKQFIKESFGRYVAPEVLDMILSNRETWFKGRKTEVTVLFADIRGFTSFSEKTDPETLINILNDYFTLMTGVIHRNRGYVDKFIGDAIMVVFGSPVHYDGHAFQAARCACEMQEKLKGFNRERLQGNHIEIGIGINSGEVVAGNLGSIQKMEYAVIGDNVNISSRLCSAAKRGEIIISKSTYENIKANEFKYLRLDPISVKGKSEPLEIFSLIPRRSPDRPVEGGPSMRRQYSSPESAAKV